MGGPTKYTDPDGLEWGRSNKPDASGHHDVHWFENGVAGNSDYESKEPGWIFWDAKLQINRRCEADGTFTDFPYSAPATVEIPPPPPLVLEDYATEADPVVALESDEAPGFFDAPWDRMVEQAKFGAGFLYHLEIEAGPELAKSILWDTPRMALKLRNFGGVMGLGGVDPVYGFADAADVMNSAIGLAQIANQPKELTAAQLYLAFDSQSSWDKGRTVGRGAVAVGLVAVPALAEVRVVGEVAEVGNAARGLRTGGASISESYLFRGTTEGFPGRYGVSPTSTSPGVATHFAVESGTAAGTDGIVYVIPRSAVESRVLPPQRNSLGYEFEVPLDVNPLDIPEFAVRAVPASRARAILQEAGYPVPFQIHSPEDLTLLLRNSPSMNASGVAAFLRALGL